MFHLLERLASFFYTWVYIISTFRIKPPTRVGTLIIVIIYLDLSIARAVFYYISLKSRILFHCQVDNADPLSCQSLKPNEKARLFNGASRIPTSPWMPFSMLFAAISTKITSQDMDAVNVHYDEFKVCFPSLHASLCSSSLVGLIRWAFPSAEEKIKQDRSDQEAEADNWRQALAIHHHASAAQGPFSLMLLPHNPLYVGVLSLF